MLAVLYIGNETDETPTYKFRRAYEIGDTDKLIDLMNPYPIAPNEFPCAVVYERGTALVSLEHHRRVNSYDWHWYTDVANELQTLDYDKYEKQLLYRRFL